MVGRQTPPQQEIIAPLEEMESQASELYDAQLQDYEQDDDNDAKPPATASTQQCHLID